MIKPYHTTFLMYVCFVSTSNSNASLLIINTTDNYRKCSCVRRVVTVNFTKILHLQKLHTFPNPTTLHHLRTQNKRSHLTSSRVAWVSSNGKTFIRNRLTGSKVQVQKHTDIHKRWRSHTLTFVA
jgi:hypothetical protein